MASHYTFLLNTPRTRAVLFCWGPISLELLESEGALRISFGRPRAKPGFPWFAADLPALPRRELMPRERAPQRRVQRLPGNCTPSRTLQRQLGHN